MSSPPGRVRVISIMPGRVDAYDGTPTAWKEVLGAAKTGQSPPKTRPDLELLRRCLRSFDIVLDAYVGAEATCNVPEHVARSLEHSDCKSKAPVMRREEHDDERLNCLGHVIARRAFHSPCQAVVC